VWNRCLFSLSPEIEIAEKQEFLWSLDLAFHDFAFFELSSVKAGY